MGLKFVFGASGSGKSRYVYEDIIERAQENPAQNFLIIVPDQFTMQTQKELVTLNPRGGIMNIDVLSFGRLSHRILTEVGGEEIPVLDDTGKSLVLQKVAADLKEQLPVLGSFLHRQGYIHEVKSAISEFMQYGIGTEDVKKLIDYAKNRGALVQKLKDLEVLYRGFVDYIHGNFITTEETLDVLCRSLPKSKIIPGSVVVFDGFTGFTPIQNRVIRELMVLCEEVVMTITLGEDENPYELDGEQKLFHLSKKTVADLSRLADEAGVKRERDVFVLSAVKEDEQKAGGSNPQAQKNSKELCGNGAGQQFSDELKKWQERLYDRCDFRYNALNRFQKSSALMHLERNLFRYQAKPFEGEQQEIRMFETMTPADEVNQIGQEIHRLIREESMAFRDIAVVIGDLEGYAPYVERTFEEMEIPVFIDRTRGIVLNPVLEYIKSALELYRKDFSYEAVFHYLRCGLSDLTPDEVDLLENYCIQTGIRGYKKFSRLFTHKTAQMEGDEEALSCLNSLRERFMAQVDMLHMEPAEQVKDYINRLYDFLVENRVQNKLAALEERFLAEGNAVRAREYAQVYRLVMELMEQVINLLGDETITLDEFADILEAGFGEIEVGTIPQNVDRVVVGDMERTRLKQVKVLFFMGVNDGNIPKNVSKGGIISDMDREFLRESQLELAPSPRQQMYIQRLYLYLNMTKPSEKLYLSYSKVNNAGKSIRPAYLIETMKGLFPELRAEYPQMRSGLEQIVTPKEGAGILAEELREYVSGVLAEDKEPEFFTIYTAYSGEELLPERGRLTEAAFRRYQDTGLSEVVARALYGTYLENSVTRLETYAACAYRHFLQYGLTLRERQEFSFENVDMGNVYHAVLEQFARKLAENHYTWFDFPKEFGEQAVKEALETFAATYGDTVLYSSARNEYAITRMGRILTRTVLTLQKQLKKGSFTPDAYELSFRYADDLDSISVALSEDERMRLQGRIDRIDVAEDEEHVYVKVIDYKSGSKQFDLVALYYGLQLQLVVYMNAAMELEKKKHPNKEVVPAALLYYRVEDPSVETPVELSDEELDQEIQKQLRMSGVVNSDPYIVEKLDGEMEDKSDVIPVERKKDGSFSARSAVLDGEDLKTVSDYVSRKIAEIGREILDGKISLNPYEKGADNACTWCAFKKVCGFEAAMPGCEKRSLENMSREEALERMVKCEK